MIDDSITMAWKLGIVAVVAMIWIVMLLLIFVRARRGGGEGE